MKLFLLSLLCTFAQAILLRQPPEQAAPIDEILAEIKHKVEVCGDSGSALAPLTLDALFAELKRREGLKECEAAAEAPPPPVAPLPTTPVPTTPATTSTTTPCPTDNFMDELVDQANPDFELYDADRDGCLTEREMTKTLRHQVEVAKERDYYWVTKNITRAHRKMEKQWHSHHDYADDNGSGCLNKDELDIIQHATCDCGSQFLLMDHNADGKVSRQEAATYVSEHMSHADLNYAKFNAIWKAVDVNGDNFLTQNEFCEAGPRYKGDGSEGAAGAGPSPSPEPAM